MANDHKLKSDEKKTVDLQSQIDASFNNPIQQTSLPKSPSLLEFKRQKDEIIKDSVEQNIIEKGLSDNHKENTGLDIQKETIQYSLYTDNVIDYYRQISQQPLIQLFLDSLKLQKDYIDVFQHQWVDHMRANVENYIAFQDKIVFLCIKNYNLYLKNIFDIKIKDQQ